MRLDGLFEPFELRAGRRFGADGLGALGSGAAKPMPVLPSRTRRGDDEVDPVSPVPRQPRLGGGSCGRLDMRSPRYSASDVT
jgi:hypothetical protein